MNNSFRIGNKYYILKSSALTLPNIGTLEYIDKDYAVLRFSDGKVSKVKSVNYSLNNVIFESQDIAMIKLAENVKNDLTGHIEKVNGFLFPYSSSDNFMYMKRKMSLNRSVLVKYINQFSYTDINFDIVGIKIHNGKKILAPDGEKYHCNQIYLLYNIVIDMRGYCIPMRLDDYMNGLHFLNPNTDFEIESSLCDSLVDYDIKNRFDYIDLIT